MAAGDSIIDISQNLFSPDIVRKISEVIGQSAERTKDGLKSAVPTFISGVFDKGSTPEGASTLVNMVNTHNYEMNTLPDESKLSEGNDVVYSIFGNNLSNTVSTLATSTGLNTSNVTKILGLVAPVIMGALGSKVKNEKLSSSGLMNFFNQQKNILGSIDVKKSEYFSLSGENPVEKQALTQRKIPWKMVLFITGLVLIGMWFWWNVVQIDSSTSEEAEQEAAMGRPYR